MNKFSGLIVMFSYFALIGFVCYITQSAWGLLALCLIKIGNDDKKGQDASEN